MNAEGHDVRNATSEAAASTQSGPPPKGTLIG
jgi:hypothetical protein